MEKSFLLILFYSASGSVKNLAHAIADGAEEQNLNVKLRTVPKISAQNKKIDPEIPKSGEIYCSKEDLINWTKSEAFRMAHKNAGGHKSVYLDHPQFEGFEVVI